MGIMVMKISVSDLDSGINGVLIYSILRGKVMFMFVINESSGVIYMNLIFDCEMKDKY